MSALTPPVAIAAVLLCVAGIAKLRSPLTAANALSALGLANGTALVRGFAIVELAIGGAALLLGGRLASGAVAVVYGVFAVLGVALWRHRASCGCFGDGDAPASAWQGLLSGSFAVTALLATIAGDTSPAHWIVTHPAGQSLTLVMGIAGAAYASVIAYTALPAAWGAWSGR